ncbi:MAG: hypothetical protein Q8R25_05080 [bacterium]|nr:hypothetical protein [bacterium]
MLTTILQHKLIAGVATIVILGGMWYGLAGSTTLPPILESDGAVTSEDQELVATLLALRTVTLSGSIFTDPVFMSLQDFGVEIISEPVGRENPFAPLAPTVAPTPQTTQGAIIFGQ